MVKMADSALTLPTYTLRLARRYWPPLLFVYLVGALLHYLLSLGVVELGLRNGHLGLVGVSITLLITLTATIVMFHMLRPGLPELDRELHERAARFKGRAAGQRANLNERERRIVDAVTMAILPFLIFYSAWGLISDEYRTYAAQASDKGGFGGLEAVSDFNPLGLPLLIALGALCARTLFERFYKRDDNKLLGVCTVVCEAVWVFFAVVSVSQLISQGMGWMTGRVVWVEVELGFASLVASLSDVTSLPLDAAVAALASGLAWAWSLLQDGLMEPLLWLTIAAVIFGADVNKEGTLFRGRSRLARIEQAAVTHTPGLVARIADIAGHGWREKYLPFLNALRFILSVSPVYYLTFCLCYALLELGAGWLHRGVFYEIGPGAYQGSLDSLVMPVRIAVEAVHEVLRVCLLAAAFEVTLRRAGRPRGRRVADQLTR